MGASLVGELEIQGIVVGKKNGITTPLVRSKQGPAVAGEGSCIGADGGPAPPGKVSGFPATKGDGG